MDVKGKNEFSLLRPEAMGGLYGSEGYTFQDRYIACHIAVWLRNPEFVRLMAELSGDVDVAYQKEGSDYYEHIQVKDHKVTPAGFREVVENFNHIDKGMGKTYRKFTLTAPAYSEEVSS